MSKNVIFCYSGSGNCLDMAKNIAKELGDTDIIMMRKAPVKTDVTDAERVGFIVPCYGGGLPGDVEKYLDSIKISSDAYTFAVGQYCGYLGCGLHKIDERFKLDLWSGLSHQCSAIWLFPHQTMVPPMTPSMAQKRSERKAKKLAKAILRGDKSKKQPPKMSVNAVESKIWPKLAVLKAKKFAVTDDCIGCHQCEKLCPKGNIKFVDGKPTFGTNCIQCLSCLQYCPKEAITLTKKTVKREHYHNPNVTAQELMESIIHID